MTPDENHTGLPDAPAETSSLSHRDDVSHLAEHLFRHESAKLVAILTGLFGPDRLQMAEDVVQEVLVRALRTWPYSGIPKNPAAWLMQAARNLAIDILRRDTLFQNKEEQIIATLEHWPSPTIPGTSPAANDEINDDRLRMMFVCCHPEIPTDDQVALALKTLCGFSVGEIARAFLTTDAAIAKRLTRAKQSIRDARIPFAIPEGAELKQRLDGVLHCLYLLFNEGYKASAGEHLVRRDVCMDAVDLATLLVGHSAGRHPKTHALLALMLLNAARFPARMDAEQNVLRLQDQNRAAWDQKLIAHGMYHLALSGTGQELSPYHLQAGIAACHAAATDYASTDWRQILKLYDALCAMDDSPVITLNRAVVIGTIQGPEAGLLAIDAIPNRRKLESYYLLYAVQAELKAQMGEVQTAAALYQKAAALTDIPSEKAFLLKRQSTCLSS